MFHKTAEPMVKTSNQVHTTTDYFLFKPIDGNRNKDLLHLNRLRKSMEQNYLFTVIIVNENYEIIDGQHRFEIISEFKLPLHYIICKGYGIKEVHILNLNSKTWNAGDFLTGYCNLGYKDYLRFREFYNKYGFGYNESIAMLTGNTTNGGSDFQKFQKGEFKITHWSDACKNAERLCLFKDFFPYWKNRSFVFAMLILFKNNNFEFVEFYKKVKDQPNLLMKCSDSMQYISLIEEIYNYRRREKINLRYSK